jgi:hypothetical protein
MAYFGNSGAGSKSKTTTNFGDWQSNLPTYQSQVKQSPSPVSKQAQQQPQRSPSIWSNIVNYGRDINKGFVAAARVLPGGQNDFKAEQNKADSALKNQAFIRNLQKQGKIKQPAAAKIIGANAQSGAPTQDPNVFKSVAKGIVQDPQIIFNKARQQVKYLAGPTSTQAQRDALLNNQSAAARATRSGKYNSKGTSAAGQIKVNSMIAKGSSKKDVTNYAASDKKAYDKNTKQGIGAGVELASFAVGGGGAKAILKGGLKAGFKQFGKSAAANTVAGASGNAGSTVLENPNASRKEITKSAFQGGAAGLGLSVAGKAASAANDVRIGRTSATKEFLTNQTTKKFNDLGREANVPKKINVVDQSTETGTKVSNIRRDTQGIPIKSTSTPTKINVKAPKTTGAVPAEHPLAAEARKYKTANEFVQAKSNAFHGGSAKHDLLTTGNGMDGEGIYTTTQSKRAAMYGARGSDGVERTPVVQRVHVALKNPLDSNKIYKRSDFKQNSTSLDKIFNYYKNGIDGDNLALQLRAGSNSNKAARDLGFDGIKKGSDVIAFNKDQVFTEKQLSDIHAQSSIKKPGTSFTMTSKVDTEAVTKGNRLTELNQKINDFAQGKSKATPAQIKSLIKERNDIKASLANPKNAVKDLKTQERTLPAKNPMVGKKITFKDLGRKEGTITGEGGSGGSGSSGRNKTANLDVEDNSLTQKMYRDTKGKPAPDPVVLNGEGNVVPKTKGQKLVAGVSHGVVNPIQSAMNRGHIAFANTVRKITNGGAAKFTAADEHLSAVEKSAKAENHTETSLSAELESGNITSKTGQMMKAKLDDLGKRLVDAGVLTKKQVRDNYAPRGATFASAGVRKVLGLSKGLANAKHRTQEIVKDELGINVKQDKYKTNADFSQGVKDLGGKRKTDLEAYNDYVTSAERAINNAKLMNELKGVAMNDGKAAVVTSKPLNDEVGYKPLPGMNGGPYVHPEAYSELNALHHSGSSLPEFLKPVAKLNSKVKRVVTLNLAVHGKNLLNGDIRERHLGAFSPYSHAKPGDFAEAEAHGAVFFKKDATQTLDELSKGSGMKGWLGTKLNSARKVSDNLLFERYGNHVAMETYLHARDKLLKNTKLSPDEAMTIAANNSRVSIMTLNKTERSVINKEVSNLVLFAGQYLHSTVRLASRATGFGTDKTLSKIGQKADMRAAQMQIVKGTAITFATAQAINYTVTGHPTWQNKGSKIAPVFYVDKTTGKEYHLTNFYGQLGDLLAMGTGDVEKGFVNKASPVVREVSQYITNKDALGQSIRDKTASKARQDLQAMWHAAGDFLTPAGFSIPDAVRMHQPGGAAVAPTIASRFLGYGASSSAKDHTGEVVDKYLQAQYGTRPISSAEKQIGADKQQAIRDIKAGNKNSPAVNKVKGEVSATSFTKFMKGNYTKSTNQDHFDKLQNTEDKLKVVEALNGGDLKQLDYSSLLKALTKADTQKTLNGLGYDNARIAKDLAKIGSSNDALKSLFTKDKADVKKQTAITRKTRGKGRAQKQSVSYN